MILLISILLISMNICHADDYRNFHSTNKWSTPSKFKFYDNYAIIFDRVDGGMYKLTILDLDSKNAIYSLTTPNSDVFFDSDNKSFITKKGDLISQDGGIQLNYLNFEANSNIEELISDKHFFYYVKRTGFKTTLVKYGKKNKKELLTLDILITSMEMEGKPRLFAVDDNIVYIDHSKNFKVLDKNLNEINSSNIKGNNLIYLTYSNGYYFTLDYDNNFKIYDKSFKVTNQYKFDEYNHISSGYYPNIVIDQDERFLFINAKKIYTSAFLYEGKIKEKKLSKIQISDVLCYCNDNYQEQLIGVNLLHFHNNKFIISSSLGQRELHQFSIKGLESLQPFPLKSTNFIRTLFNGTELAISRHSSYIYVVDYKTMDFIGEYLVGEYGGAQNYKLLSNEMKTDGNNLYLGAFYKNFRHFLRLSDSFNNLDTIVQSKKYYSSVQDFTIINNYIYLVWNFAHQEDRREPENIIIQKINKNSFEIEYEINPNIEWGNVPFEIHEKNSKFYLISPESQVVIEYDDDSFQNYVEYSIPMKYMRDVWDPRSFKVSKDKNLFAVYDNDSKNINIYNFGTFDLLKQISTSAFDYDITCLDIENDGSYIYFGTKENGAFYLNTLTEEISETPSNKRLPKIYDEESNSLKYYSIEKIEIYHDTRELMIISEGGLVEFIKLPNTIGSVNTSEEGIGAISYLSSDVITILDDYVVDELRVYDLMGRELEVEQLSTHQYKIKNTNERVIFSRISIGEKTYTEKYILER